jgi:hypothetical protein
MLRIIAVSHVTLHLIQLQSLSFKSIKFKLQLACSEGFKSKIFDVCLNLGFQRTIDEDCSILRYDSGLLLVCYRRLGRACLKDMYVYTS